jgi:hypothetical protein
MAYFYFPKILEKLEEFRKNPHVQIPSKSPYRNSQSLAKIQIHLKFKNQSPFEISPRIQPSRPSLPALARSA